MQIIVALLLVASETGYKTQVNS